MHNSSGPAPLIGVVVIGRNEGDRLRNCLSSGVRETPLLVYVDSGSTDNSVKLARSMGVETIELDPGIPFSAARGRNEGFRRLRHISADMGFVQFVDGDCDLCTGWLEEAASYLRSHENTGVVSGRLREK